MKVKNQLLIAICSVSILISCVSENIKNKKYGLKADLDSLILSEYESGRFSGTIVIGNSDSIITSRAFGKASRVWNIDLRPQHRFDIASINKSFIGALIVIASNDGKLDLKDKLVDHLQDFNYQGSFDPEITLHHLLTHTSGLADYDGVSDELKENNFLKFKRKRFSNASYIEFLSTIKPRSAVEEKFYYSNFGYHILTIVLEQVYQKSFGELLQEKICKPLSLENTFSPSNNEEVYEDMAEAYSFVDSTRSWIRNNYIDLSIGRRIFSTSHDLYLWARAVSSQETKYDQWLDVGSRKLLQMNHISNLNSNLSYGYGWVVHDGQGEYPMGKLPTKDNYIIHGGSTEGFKSMLVSIQQGKFIISFLANIGNETNEMQLTEKIVDVLNKYQNE